MRNPLYNCIHHCFHAEINSQRDLKSFPGSHLTKTQLFFVQVSKWIKTADLSKLEHAAYNGRGNFMRGRTAWNEEIRQFLQTVPNVMVRT